MVDTTGREHRAGGAEPEQPGRPEIGRRLGLDVNSGITVRRLRIFWVVAQSDTLTRASKQLGLTQPSLSQHISNLEAALGTPLFDRRSNRMALTEAGQHLMRSVEPVLASLQRFEDGLHRIGSGTRQTLRIAGINSALRVLLPPALAVVSEATPDTDYDIHEAAPADVLEMLFSRRVTVGLLAANSIAPVSAGFLQVPIHEDPYVLAVPEALRLDGVRDPAAELSPQALRTLGRSIQFAFGTPQGRRVQAWYDRAIPGNWPFTQARSFEVALGMVRAGLGVCLTPAISSVVGRGPVDGLRLYRVDFPPRQIVALLPTQYARAHPYADLVAALQAAGAAHVTPGIGETPPFLRDFDDGGADA